MPRVLLAIPFRGGSFENIARQLARRLVGRYRFTIATLAEVEGGSRYDLAVVLFWPEETRLRARLGDGARFAYCVYDHVSWMGVRPELLRDARFASVIIVGSPLLAEAVRAVMDAPVVLVCQDGVDLELFLPLPRPESFVVGWCGNQAAVQDDHKGVRLIEAAAERVGVPLVVQDFASWIPQASMGEAFYRQISCYVCASESEGTPNPVLEALACGRPVITTRVGITDQVVRHGENGLFVERTASALAEAIAEVRGWPDRSQACRAAVEPHGWDAAAARWGDALERALA